MDPWVGFDFDGTLVTYPPKAGQEYGDDIPVALTQLRIIRNMGMKVKIVTARAGCPETAFYTHVIKWLYDHGLSDVDITDRKDYGMLLLFDDRAITMKDGAVLTDSNFYADKMKEIIQWVNRGVPSLGPSVNGPSVSVT